MNKVIEDYAKKLEDKVIEYRRDFHKYPEIGWTEFRTASLIARRLIELGYDINLGKEVINEHARMGLPSDKELEENYIRAVNQGADRELIGFLKGGFTGVVGTLDCGNGPTVALRFDIDALDIQESADHKHLPVKEKFYSVNKNVMHACGHDGHAAIGLGVAEILSKIKDEINGTVKLIFQPAEEGVRGAKSMVESGVLKEVDYLLSGHIGLKAEKSGQIICGAKGFLATSKFDAVFTGKSAHAGADPEKGKNALLAAATAVLNLHAIPRNSQGVTRINVGKLIAGTGRNVIPERAHMLIETRGETSELNNYMIDYAVRVLDNAAQMHGSNLEIRYMGEALSAESDDEMVKRVSKIASHIIGYHLICDKTINFGASEDFSYMMDRIQAQGGKSVYIIFGSDLKSCHHTSNFDFNENDLINAVKAFSMLAIDILQQKQQ